LGIRIPFLGSQGATQNLPNHIEMVFDVVLICFNDGLMVFECMELIIIMMLMVTHG
jgi:hypothetical protein